MPIYIYKNKYTGDYTEIFQGMNDEHEYRGENDDEDFWVRVYTIPNASIDTRVDPFSSKSFIDATSNKNETVGSMLDRSKELSLAREHKEGIDMIKEKSLDKYEKRRNLEHPERRRKRLKESLSKKGLDIEI